MIGVRLEPHVVFVSLPFPEALAESARQNAKNATLIYSLLRGIAERRMSPKAIAGPVRIVADVG